MRGLPSRASTETPGSCAVDPLLHHLPGKDGAGPAINSLFNFRGRCCAIGAPRGPWIAVKLAELAAGQADQFQADVVVPVPFQRNRSHERGYNQARVNRVALSPPFGIEDG